MPIVAAVMAPEDALIVLLAPPLTAGVLAFVAITVTSQRSIQAWLATLIAGWLAILILPGLHDVLAAGLGAFATAGTGLVLRRLEARAREPGPPSA